MQVSLIPLSRAKLPEPAMPVSRLALFLDLDGTLAPIAETPDAVGPVKARSDLLHALVKSLAGRVAILSGRTIADVDRILERSVVAVAGIHGLERPTSSANLRRTETPEALRPLRDTIDRFAAGRSGILVEDKGLSLAVHYRHRPQDAAEIVALTARLAAGAGLVVQRGHMVSEIRAPGPNKGDAVAAFMKEPPFAGSLPFVVGDDLTDEAAFERVAEFGGTGVLVGTERPTAASYRLAGVSEALGWLALFLGREQGEGVAP
jgi:trehalose 6-phosphate phosphatase